MIEFVLKIILWLPVAAFCAAVAYAGIGSLIHEYGKRKDDR